jgi:cytochrome P450
MKMLEANQDVQNKLRAELRSAFSSARSEGRVPTAQEVANVQSHYLDACIEEFIRCSRTAVVLSRTALTDVVVLGHVIPKGTMVLLPTSGGTLEAPWKIDDKSRNQTYHNADGGKVGEWDKEGIEKFKPERWLVHDPDTNSKVYDAQAGPNIMFGAGPRGCFGKKLAYLELKLAIVLIVWSFELQQLPERYASWDAMDSLTHSPITCYAKLAEA